MSQWLCRSFCSSIGAKVVMAVTGLLMFGFLVEHLTGNLLFYSGQQAFNDYAHFMQGLGAIKWIARAGLMGVLCAHLAAAAHLTYHNRRARPVGYAFQNTVQASFASRTMPMTGLIIFFFILFHLAHYTVYVVDPSFVDLLDATQKHDAYLMVIQGFSSPVVSGFYIIAMLLLGMHLSHGLSSLFQSLGINHSHFTPMVKIAGPIIAWVVALGFISIPVSVFLGVIH